MPTPERHSITLGDPRLEVLKLRLDRVERDNDMLRAKEVSKRRAEAKKEEERRLRTSTSEQVSPEDIPRKGKSTF